MDNKVNIKHAGYNNIKSNINLIKSSEDKVIIFTSILPDEGKTKVAFNTALQFANTGKSVMYLDLNFNDKTKNVSIEKSENNLFSYLENRSEFDDVIQRYNFNDKFIDYVFSGHTSDCTSDLYEKPKFKELIDELRNQYDIVILDSPVWTDGPDVKIIATVSDGAIIVIKK